MNIAVFGTPQLSANIFEKIRQFPEMTIVAAVTVPDMPAGRGKKMMPSPVKVWAENHGIPLFQPQKPKRELAENLRKMKAEVSVVLAYGYIFSQEFLDSAPQTWNLHLSLLPKFRGSSPVPTAILAGEKTSGVTVFRIQKGMDSGPILGRLEFDIQGDRANTISEKIEDHGSQLLLSLLQKKCRNEEIAEIPQEDSSATFCKKIFKQDGFLNPKSETAECALRKIRAYYPWPGTSVEYQGKRLKILNARLSNISLSPHEFCFEKNGAFLGFSSGTLELLEVQIEGKKAMSGTEFGRGQKV